MGRMPSSRILVVVLSSLFVACGSAPEPEPDAEAPPNIVIILADDLGHGDLGVTGAPDVRTPNIDRIAAEGVRFTRAYSNGAVCSPTRAALLSGQYQQRTGVDRVIYVGERELGLSPEVKLLPAYLKPAGYASGIFGKWHLGYPKESFPTRFGFDEFVGFVAGNIDYFAHTDRLENPDLWRGEEAITDERYMTDLIGDEAVDFIDRHAESGPFLLYLPFNAPHDPFQGPGDRDSAGDQELTRQTYRTRAKFVEMVESLDANVGKVLERLDEGGLAERTAVFFMSDNGGLPVVARNAPFSGFKTELWEGGIRSPLLARLPGRFAAGETIDAPVAGMDLFATSLDLAGVGLPEDRPIDGESLVPLLEGRWEKLDRDALFFRYQDPSDGVAQAAMMSGGWKYLRDAEGGEYLFHLAEDEQEKSDRSADQPELLEQMRRTWGAWEREVLAGAPTLPPRE